MNVIYYLLLEAWHAVMADISLVAWLLPMMLMYELPIMLLVSMGIVKFFNQHYRKIPKQSLYHPKVSCIITCYAEGEAVVITLRSLVEQLYPGELEIVAVVDGAVQNSDTYNAATKAAQQLNTERRRVLVLPKWQRGGRVSTLNAGLSAATGEIVINADADTSFDNDMVSQIVRYFEDPNVPAVAGCLRVRNVETSLVTRMQAIEYLLSIQGGKTGLSQWNLINNVSGAFGAFRRKILLQIGGWDTHTAEDLDLTLRLKQYFARNPGWYIPFATLAIGHTDVPDTSRLLFLQRLRWDGDLLFLYFRKHWQAFTPKLLGWRTFWFTLLYGLLMNVMLPALIVIYTLGVVWIYPWQVSAGIALGIYAIYFLILGLFYIQVLLAVSERPRQDLKLFIWLPLYPVYALVMRMVCLFALLNEALRRSHEESAMAPWWVLKRGGRF